MFEAEDSYGLRKRLQYAASIIEALQPGSVLEIGCGTGAYLLAPLSELFPQTRFVGVDSDKASVDFARTRFGKGNLHFELSGSVIPPGTHDLVIASEVLEHVDRPVAFLRQAREAVAPGGKILMTVPNGYGPFELVSMLQGALEGLGLIDAMRRLKRRTTGQSSSAIEGVPMSLANSPHVNFFSWGAINRVIQAAGLRVEDSRNRTFLCGFGLDILVGKLGMAGWNAKIADRLPKPFVSDWMFLLSPTAETFASGEYIPGAWAKFRRRWNIALAAKRG